ncbi:hypothetical protein Dimus_003739, partial [Dionaea muscipula]
MAVAGVYSAERLNRLLGQNWESFSSQNYFDAHGIFLSNNFIQYATCIVPHGKGDRYVAHIKNDSSLRSGESNQLPVHENEFLSNLNSYGNEPSLNDETPPSSSPTEPTRPEKSSRDGLKNFNGSVYAPKELCLSEGLGVDFRAQPVVSASGHMDEAYAE